HARCSRKRIYDVFAWTRKLAAALHLADPGPHDLLRLFPPALSTAREGALARQFRERHQSQFTHGKSIVVETRDRAGSDRIQSRLSIPSGGLLVRTVRAN